MMAVHGRAAYHGEKTIGHVDGGSYVGKLIFEGIYNYYKEKAEKHFSFSLIFTSFFVKNCVKWNR